MARRRLFAAALAAMLISTVSAGTASATEGTWVKKLSDCIPFYWAGSPINNWSYNKPVQSKGTGLHCAYLYKETETDPNADYWMVTMEVEWDVTVNAVNPLWSGSYDNKGVGTIWSTATASASGATDDVVMQQGGCMEFSASVGIPGTPIGFGVPVKLCNPNTVLDRTSKSLHGASWYTSNVVYTPLWGTGYVQRVAPGVRPTFWSYVNYPKYTVYDTGTTECRYYCFTIWGTTKTMRETEIQLHI